MVKLRVAHSPDSDDAFMFYPLLQNKVDSSPFEIEQHLKDIETLNEEALKGTYEVSALSFHAFPYISKDYYLLRCGGSFGLGYGPLLVSRGEEDLKGKRVAVPGRLTSAYLLLKLYEKDFKPLFVPFDKVIDYLLEGKVDFGLLIHEGQLTYSKYGLKKVLDLGEWWMDRFSLPTPLGGNVIKKSLGKELIKRFEEVFRNSIVWALKHKGEVLKYAKNFARDLKEDEEKTERFVLMYVNSLTIDCGKEGEEAVKLLIKLGIKEGIIKANHPEEFFLD